PDLSALREDLERRRPDAGRVADDRQVATTGALDRADERRRPALDDPEAADEKGRAVLDAGDRLVAARDELVPPRPARARAHPGARARLRALHGTGGHGPGATRFEAPVNLTVVSLDVAGDFGPVVAHITGPLPMRTRMAIAFCGAWSSWYIAAPLPRIT